jgi:outer membrane protein assembly factor BamB
VTCYNGEICFLNLIDGKVLYKIALEGHVMANIEFMNESDQRILYVPTVEGILYELKDTFDSFEITSATTITYHDEHNNQTGYSIAELYSPPLIQDGKLFLGFARQTYYNYPAIVCLDANSKSVLWYASDPSYKGSHFGNVRTNLLEDNGQILFTHPYSNELVGLNKMTGEIEWVVNLGRNMFQQWASPIKNDSGYFLSRYDGYLYKVHKSSKQRQWGMYLGQSEDAGIVFDSSQKVGNENEHTAWELFKGYSLISTPALYNENLIVGSDEGILYCLSNVL